MKVSYHTFLFLNDVDLPFAIDGNKKVESWLNLFAQSIESIKSWSDDYEVDIFVHSDTELDEFKCKSNLVLHDDGKFVDKLLQVRLFIQHHLNREYDTYIMSEADLGWRQETLEYFEEHNDRLWSERTLLGMFRVENTDYKNPLDYNGNKIDLSNRQLLTFSDDTKWHWSDLDCKRPSVPLIRWEKNKEYWTWREPTYRGSWIYSQEQLDCYMESKLWDNPPLDLYEQVESHTIGMNDPRFGIFNKSLIPLVDGKFDSRSRIIHYGQHEW